MYKIGELSKLSHLSVKTLRFYDSEGILVPDEIDKFTGYRFYSASKLIDCRKIVLLKELGYSLEEIKQYLNANSGDDILALLESKKDELETQDKKIKSQIKRLDKMQKLMKEKKNNMYDVIIRNNDAIRVASKRKIFADKSEINAEINKIKTELPSNIRGDKMILINYETEYREANIDLAICYEITSSLPNDSEYTERQLNFSGDTASLICKVSEIDDGYEALYHHIFEGDFQIVGAYYEIYYDEETVELRIPVCKKIACDGAVAEIGNFENDSEAIGKWKLIDAVSCREQFVYGNAKCSDVENLPFNELYFLKGGEQYWTVDGWTKGKIFRSAEFPTRHTVAENYSIENISGHTILFVEKNRIFPDGKMFAVPEFWIYEKISSDEFSARDIQIQDNTDYPFQSDSAVLGKWEVFDFYSKGIENFNPKIQNRKRDELFVRFVEFLENGKCVYVSQNSNWETDWTKGLVLNHNKKTASAYQIKNIDGIDYLILEWKSSNYTYGGKTNWYVFVRTH